MPRGGRRWPARPSSRGAPDRSSLPWDCSSWRWRAGCYGRRAAGDPQWNQRLVIYSVQLAVCIGCILYGLSESAPRAGVEDTREELLFLGLFGLATSTVFLFFGSIDWSTWNAIKELMASRKTPPEDRHPPDHSADD